MIQERRLFSIPVGDIFTLVRSVLELPRTEEVAIVLNDTIVPVYTNDTRDDVIARWSDKHSNR